MSMIQVFGTKKCRSTQAVLRFFKERNLAHSFIDMAIKAPSPGELDAMAQALGGHEALIDTEGREWKDGGWGYKDQSAREALLEEYRLYKTPLVRKGRHCVAGHDEAGWKTFLEKS